MADEANHDKDENSLFIDAVGGRKHGRIRGFGSVLDNHLTRALRPPTVSSVSSITNIGEKVFMESHYLAMLEERDRRQEEEREERKREQANNNHLFSQLFSLLAGNQTTLPVCTPHYISCK